MTIPTKGPTSLTKDQQTSAEKYAQGVREDYLTKHGVPIKGKKAATAESGADFDGDDASARGLHRERKYQNADGSLTPEGREPKASDNTPAKRADDYVNKHKLENAKAVEVAAESIHKENFRTSQTDEYRSKLASLRNKGDKKLQSLMAAKEKAEKEYLNIAEDDFTVHDDHYRNEHAKADLANKLASQELIKYVMSQK